MPRETTQDADDQEAREMVCEAVRRRVQDWLTAAGSTLVFTYPDAEAMMDDIRAEAEYLAREVGDAG